MTTGKKIVIGNWKMKLSITQSRQLAAELSRHSRPEVQVVVCPSFTALPAVALVVKGSAVDLGAQDMFWEAEGAFTGEISASQLKEVGCRLVILGHSERRQNFSETDEMVHRKVAAALAAGLTPIICVGETYDERQRGAQDYVLIRQVTKALEGVRLSSTQSVVVAYEPVWVVGSGRAIAPVEAGLAHQVIRQTLIDLFPPAVVNSQFRIIYGGSVDSRNVGEFTSLEFTAGVLVGGASLNFPEFSAIIRNV